MSAIIAFLLLIIAWAIMKDKPIKIEISHKYPEPKIPEGLKDPHNDRGEMDSQVKDAVADVISTLNDIMMGGGVTDGADDTRNSQ